MMNSTQHIEICPLKPEQYSELLDVMKMAYPNWQGGYWSEKSIQKLTQIFPEGQLVVLIEGKVAGCALSLIVDYEKFGDRHTYEQITGNYTFSTFDENGKTLYGIEVFIHPDYRGLRLGRRLYDARKELAEKLNLKNIIFCGRIPFYHKYVDELSPKQYLEKVKHKEIYDPVLSFQMSNDFHVKKIIKNYIPDDVQSKEFATLLEWNNVFYEDEDSDKKTPKKDKEKKDKKTPKKDREEKSPVIPKSGKDEKDTKITKKDKEDKITTTSKKDNNNDVQDKLPETGKTNDIQNPALIMLLAGLGLLGLFRNKIRE